MQVSPWGEINVKPFRSIFFESMTERFFANLFNKNKGYERKIQLLPETRIKVRNRYSTCKRHSMRTGI